MTTQLKTCAHCGVAKPATTDHFYRNNKAKDGLYANCKVCEREREAKRVRVWSTKPQRPTDPRSWRGDSIEEFGLAGDVRAAREARELVAQFPPIQAPPRLARIPGMIRLPCGALVRQVVEAAS